MDRNTVIFGSASTNSLAVIGKVGLMSSASSFPVKMETLTGSMGGPLYPSRDTLHARRLFKSQDCNLYARHLQASETYRTAFTVKESCQPMDRCDSHGHGTAGILATLDRKRTERPILTTDLESKAFLEFTLHGARSELESYQPWTISHDVLLPGTRSHNKLGIARSPPAFQSPSMGSVSRKSSRDISFVGSIGIPKDSSTMKGQNICRGRDASVFLRKENPSRHIAAFHGIYYDSIRVSSQVAYKIGMALVTCPARLHYSLTIFVDTCRGMINHLQKFLKSDAQHLAWPQYWELGSGEGQKSCPSLTKLKDGDSKTAPISNICQHNKVDSEGSPSDQHSGDASSPRRRKRNTQRDKPNGLDQSHDDDDDCPEDFNRKRSRFEDFTADKNDSGISLACPYYKDNKLTHNRCSLLQLNRIRDVKQHLYRKHMQPYHCFSCGRQFNTQIEQMEHSRLRECSTRNYQRPDGITLDQQRDLKERVDRKLAVDQQWFAVWKIVFPDKEPPKSPYVYSPTREVATNMRTYWQETAAEMMADHVSRVPGVDSGRIIGGLNTLMDNFFRRFIEEHSSVTEGEQALDSYTDGSPGNPFPKSSRPLPRQKAHTKL
ncbi:hypothetical protein CFIO01_04943 [Colletotrichum fioriniae PJ7]|uniref:C2H2-type domain-containing protein n=1 Tax=Colletotrichum fioriniae PJ7 TaxID=1445577 RepID=A0A010RT93_9PEZI|nr:hypothetical protein CFIO01_04943 [Colletotrichum fioriniae PJ7]